MSERYEPVYSTPLPPVAFEELVKAAEAVWELGKSEDESPAIDDAFVAAMVRLRDATRAARPLISPPGPPNPPRSQEMFG